MLGVVGVSDVCLLVGEGGGGCAGGIRRNFLVHG